MLLYIVSLLLSLPNLIAGLAVFFLGKTFSGRDVFEILDIFFGGLFHGTPIAAGVIIVLLLAGCITETRPYAAVLAFTLNVAALAVVLVRVAVPTDLSQGVFFLPVLLALLGFAWIAYKGFAERGQVRAAESAT